MPGQVFELLGLVTLAGFAGVGGIVLFTAGIEAIEHSAFVGILVLCFSLVLFVTAASVGGWGVLEWHRAERAAPPVESTARDAEGRIKSLREAFRQPVAIQLMVKVAFFCSTLNLGVEIFYLRRCHRIFLISTPEGPPDPHYCDNLAWSAHGINSINPHTRTFLTEMPGTALAIGFFSTIFSYGEIQRAILGQKWNYPFTGARCPPWVEPLDSKLLDEGFIRHWATGNKHNIIRSRMLARAPVLAFQLMAFWTLPPILLLWVIHMADTQDWDGGMDPHYFIAFKTVWCACVGLNSTYVGFCAATADKTFSIIRRRFAEQPTGEGMGSSFVASRDGRSLAETRFGVDQSPNIQSRDL